MTMKKISLVLFQFLIVFQITLMQTQQLQAAQKKGTVDYGIHEPWQALLQAHVYEKNRGTITAVDYGGFKKAKPALEKYLDDLARVSRKSFDAMSQEDQLAFLINAYNAWTIRLIITEYPSLESIRDLGSFFSSPWDKEIVKLFGETITLDKLEHGLIREDHYEKFGVEPRIHFAVNCASIGCPALMKEAFVGHKLDQQLEKATKLFLQSRERNYMQGDTLYVSKIFRWYRSDFETGWRGLETLEHFLLSYYEALDIPQAKAKQLKQDEPSVDFLDYDWGLNDYTPTTTAE